MCPAPVRTTGIAIAAVVVVVLPFLLLILQFGVGRDQGVYLVIARAMEAGGLPYRDVWDIKPPGIFFVYRFVRALERFAELRTLVETDYEEQEGTTRFRYFRRRGGP